MLSVLGDVTRSERRIVLLARHRGRSTVIGTGTYPGAGRTLTVRLAALGRRLLARPGALAAFVEARAPVIDDGGHPVAVQRMGFPIRL